MPLTLAVDQIQPASAGSKYLDWQGVPTGMPIAINVITYGTRTSLSGNEAYKGKVLFGDYFTKLRNDTILRATTTVFGASFSAGNCGVGAVIDFNTANEQWDFGTGYQYDGAWTQSQQMTLITGHHQWTGIRAGRHLMSYGWYPAGNNSGNLPFNIFCPNNNDDGRNQQTQSRIVIFEVAP
jgi:hypothetical protein